jgi:hypothetical protein
MVVRGMADGLVAVVKRDCPTCRLIAPALAALARDGGLSLYSQDDPAFPEGLAGVRDDRELEASYHFGVEIVPTLIRLADGREAARAVGWNRDEWRALSGRPNLGAGLPEHRPGCGSRTQEPGMTYRLRARFSNTGLASRQIRLPAEADLGKACYERGWSDGLPVVPPTVERVLEILDATPRAPGEVIGLMPPNLVECTVEKVAINAVMAGCLPEYMPVLLAAVEAALLPAFNLHAIVATTNAVGPVVMVNGPIAQRIGMNAKGNVFGQGNRANASIGRALQLVVRNVGGGLPGEIDRAVFGNPGKYGFCFAEDESDSRWQSYAVEQGFPPEASTVTLFAGDGVTPIIDHTARQPEELLVSYTDAMLATYNRRQVNEVACFLVVGGEHQQVFYQAGWSKARLRAALDERLKIPVGELVPGRSGLGPLSAEERARPDLLLPKFRTGGYNIIRAGGSAGKYSAIISAIGSSGLRPVTKEIAP